MLHTIVSFVLFLVLMWLFYIVLEFLVSWLEARTAEYKFRTKKAQQELDKLR